MKGILLFVVVALLLLVVPVGFAQVAPDEGRALVGVNLEDTDYSEVSFYNAAQDIQLAGMLFVPEGDGPFPAAVIIHGNGTSHRENRWYLTMTQYLQENGVAVLLPDKRGSVQSEGDWRGASFADLATDTVAAVDFLKEQDMVAISEIGIIGMSQGGHLSPVAATMSADISFIVDVVGAAVTLQEQLLFEENNNLREMGFLPGLSNLIAYPSAWSIREMRQKAFWTANGDFDPLPYWAQVDVETLVLYGEQDPNVPAAESAARLESLGKENISVTIYAGSGHPLEDPPGTGNRYFRLDALEAIREFILTTMAK